MAATVGVVGTAALVEATGKAETRAATIGAAGILEVRPVMVAIPVPISMMDRMSRSDQVVAGADRTYI